MHTLETEHMINKNRKRREKKQGKIEIPCTLLFVTSDPPHCRRCRRHIDPANEKKTLIKTHEKSPTRGINNEKED